MAGDRLVPERLVHAAQDAAPLLVIAGDLADGVQHLAALGIHVAGALVIHAIHADDGPVILDALPVADDVVGTGLLPEQALSVDAFGIIGEAFVYPHVGIVLCGDVVAEPFMGALVHDDEIPLHAESRA